MLWISLGACLIAAVVGYGYNRWGEARDARRCPPPGEMVDIGGRRLHLLRKGRGGPTVIIENGSGASSHIWWLIQDNLAELTSLCVYDRAGLGWSDPAPLPRTVSERAKDLHELLRRAEIPPPYILVAYSHGGLIARRFALEHPNEVVGFIFVDSGHELVYAAPEIVAKRTSAGFKLFGYLSHIGLVRAFGWNISAFIRTQTPYTLNEAQRHLIAKRISTAHSYFVGADENRSAIECAAELAGIAQPGCLGNMPIVAVTHGIAFPGKSGASEEKWRTAQGLLAALSSNSELVVATYSGHAVPLEDPTSVIDAIRKVVTAVRTNQKLSVIG